MHGRIQGIAQTPGAAPSHLAHGEEHRFFRVRVDGLQQLQHIVVVSTGQTLVAGDQNICLLSRPGFGHSVAHEGVGDVRQVGQHIADHRLGGVVMGAGGLHLPAGLAHLGRGDQVHGVGDLPGVTDAFHAVLQIVYARHAPLLLYSAQPSRMACRSSSVRTPVSWMRRPTWGS